MNIVKWLLAQIRCNWLMAQIRFGRWAYLVAGVCIGAVFFAGAAIAQSVTTANQGSPGKFGAWPVRATLLSPDGGVGTLPVTTMGFTTGTTVETLVGVTPTTMPLTTGAVSQILQNLGPNAIYCSTTQNGSNNPDAGLLDAGAALTYAGVQIASGASATFDTTAQLYCTTVTLQVAGAGTRIIAVDAVDTARLSAAGSSGGGSIMSVGVPTRVSLSAGVSGSICSLTPASSYRISCGAAASWRMGAATPTAVSTDSALFANTIMDVKMAAGATCLAFISTSAVDCRAALLTP